MLTLTPEQESVVAHKYGAALVFAVAGAGKTTAMVHRIARLVSEGIFPAQSILATSFSKATVNDIQNMLKPWPDCQFVQTRTLHGLGFSIIKKAQKSGLFPNYTLPQAAEGGQKQLLYRTLTAARQSPGEFPNLDNLDQDDFLTFIQSCKAQLAYPDVSASHIPEALKKHISNAKAPEDLPHYMDLFILFEKIRHSEQLLTFDDMLLSAVEVIFHHPQLLAQVQEQFQCILVDEYQDINLVQHVLIDAIVKPHGNLMAIGDDDQTIYEWRGANPKFILNFESHYKSEKFLIRENFRSQAAHVALANAVIKHNIQREPKTLNLTQGFDGDVLIHPCDSPEAQGKEVGLAIAASLEQGYKPSEIAVLLRLYAQTPFIEQALIDAQIPYQIVGSTPFYQRPEIKTFLAYLYLAKIDFSQQNRAMNKQFDLWWKRIYNQPKRYLSRQVYQDVRELVLLKNTPLIDALYFVGGGHEKPFIRKKINALADLFQWLEPNLADRSASEVLKELDTRLQFSDFLRNNSGFPETGEGRAQTVQAFIDYAKDKGDIQSLMDHLRQASFEQSQGKRISSDKKITLTTAYRAKGLEWPIVMVPGCNHGVFPMGGPEQLEAERRLFYVAITRPQATLHLFFNRMSPVSLFLRQAEYRTLIEDVSRLQSLQKKLPLSWSTEDTQHWVSTVPRLKLNGYFRQWWDVDENIKTAIATQAQLYIKKAQNLGLLKNLKLRASHQDLWKKIAPNVPTNQLNKLFLDLEDTKEVKVRNYSNEYDISETVEHPEYGSGKVIKVIPGSRQVMVMIDFRQSGRTLIPINDLSPIS